MGIERDGLLTIGVFATRARLSAKALRLYDSVGLLVPADVDPENGYRRYRESQLATARLIVMLRRLDMPPIVARWRDSCDTRPCQIIRTEPRGSVQNLRQVPICSDS